MAQWLCICITVITLAMDVALVQNHQRTESQEIKDWSLRWTWLPFAFGVLMGHWFAPGVAIRGDLYGPLGGILVLFVWDLLFHYFITGDRPWYRYPLLYVFLGMPVGCFLWGQN